MYISLKLSKSIISFHVTSPEYKEKFNKKLQLGALLDMNMLNRVLQFDIQELHIYLRKFWQLTSEVTAGQRHMKAIFILLPG